jgi:hypothetical protein
MNEWCVRACVRACACVFLCMYYVSTNVSMYYVCMCVHVCPYVCMHVLCMYCVLCTYILCMCVCMCSVLPQNTYCSVLPQNTHYLYLPTVVFIKQITFTARDELNLEIWAIWAVLWVKLLSARAFTAEDRVRSHVCQCNICSLQGTETGFYSSTAVFPCQNHSTNVPYSTLST